MLVFVESEVLMRHEERLREAHARSERQHPLDHVRSSESLWGVLVHLVRAKPPRAVTPVQDTLPSVGRKAS
jgi:hypothetical protein